MKASVRWLRELLPGLDASAAEIAQRLTKVGLEVEGTTEFGEATTSCVVAKVVSIRPHPSKSGLRLVTVDRGGEPQEVVCGAPNVPEPGGLVVLAPLGTYLPAKKMKIERRAIGGVESDGMLCSESELGLGEDHGGILVLASGTPGATFAETVPTARDTVLEIGLTPNRPDGLGHVGLARELAAVMNLSLRLPEIPAPETTTAIGELATIVVEDAERCPHYGAAAVLDVAIAPSPLWARYRLAALGVRAISNVVDVTNLVMLEHGHPMHGFDLDRVSGHRIVVRRARPGEKMRTLDEVERTLAEDDLVIADAAVAAGIAGVMGGATSEVNATTKRVLFECAWFEPRGVRRASRRHGLHTEASHRFERGVDPGDVARVLDRAVALTIAFAGGKAANGQIHVQGTHVAATPIPPARRSIRFRGKRTGELLGVEIPFADQVSILTRLGCTVKSQGEEADVLVPTHRPDLGREVDLVEEVLRLHGIDAIPAELPAIRASRDVGGREALARRAREAATAVGLSEAITYGFTSTKALAALSAPEATVRLKNPLAEHQAVMRTTLLPGLLDAVSHARRHGERDVREFTIGPVFLPGPDLPLESLRLAFVLAGDRAAWLEKARPFDVWDALGFVDGIVQRIANAEVLVTPLAANAPRHLHPRGAGSIAVLGRTIGTFGPLHPAVIDELELDGEVMVAEIDLAPFAPGAVLPRYAPIPRFPASARDVALVVKDGIPAGEVEAAVRSAAGPLAAGVRLFDRFVGGAIPAGSSSLAFRVVYRAEDRTLTDAEVDAAHANVVSAVGSRFGATLRA